MNDKWRGRTCTYHEGYADGLEVGLRAGVAGAPVNQSVVAEPAPATPIFNPGFTSQFDEGWDENQ